MIQTKFQEIKINLKKTLKILENQENMFMGSGYPPMLFIK